MFDVDGNWIGHINTLRWYLRNGDVGATKVLEYDFSENYTALDTHQTKIRNGQISKLIQSSRLNPKLKDSISTLLTHYYTEKQLWIDEGTNDLKNAITTENNGNIKAILDGFYDDANTITVRQGILAIIADLTPPTE